MKKIVHIGRGSNGNVFCKIEIKDGRLSISGVEGPKSNGDCRGSCGQIDMHPWGIKEYAAGWDATLEAKFREAWGKWHLNDMRAGSPAQAAFLGANPVTDHLNHFTAACAALEAAGLQPDPGYVIDGEPYKYGSRWLREDLPQEVIEFLESLPASRVTPAWV